MIGFHHWNVALEIVYTQGSNFRPRMSVPPRPRLSSLEPTSTYIHYNALLRNNSIFIAWLRLWQTHRILKIYQHQRKRCLISKNSVLGKSSQINCTIISKRLFDTNFLSHNIKKISRVLLQCCTIQHVFVLNVVSATKYVTVIWHGLTSNRSAIS